MDPRITVFALFYGDHTDLAKRCLNSIVPWLDRHPLQLRVGMNAVSDDTGAFVESLVQQGKIREQDVYISDTNIHKYPLMRRMFYDPDNAIETNLVMWFDDDSYVKSSANEQWLDRVETAMESADMLGSIYMMNMQGNQHRWVEDQPWYNGKPVAAKQKVLFITGGWWCVRTALLEKYNWPIPELDHRGGDVMLGELIRQQGLTIMSLPSNDARPVAINANEQGVESKAKKRGFDQAPIGARYDPGVTKAMHESTKKADLPYTNLLDI